MSREEQVTQLTDYMAKFIAHVAKKLPDDVIAKLQELREKEDSPLSKVIYDTMFRNQELAVALNRPSCQDTGVLQFWVKCGTKFPLIDDLEALLKEAVVKATFEAPLRHNSVETFDEYNTGKNVGKGTPTVFWDIVPNSDKCEIYTYMAGGGCTLPGKAMVLMPGEGYEGVTKFVLDVMTSYGLNACPPLLVGVGVATSVETAALLSKKALMRPIGSHNDNERAAKMENLLEDGINAIGLGPQGMGGKYSVMGVNIENTARHPSAIGVAILVLRAVYALYKDVGGVLQAVKVVNAQLGTRCQVVCPSVQLLRRVYIAETRSLVILRQVGLVYARDAEPSGAHSAVANEVGKDAVACLHTQLLCHSVRQKYAVGARRVGELGYAALHHILMYKGSVEVGAYTFEHYA